jgi:hypothetical protein
MFGFGDRGAFVNPFNPSSRDEPFSLNPTVELNRREQRKQRANDFDWIRKGTKDSPVR